MEKVQFRDTHVMLVCKTFLIKHFLKLDLEQVVEIVEELEAEGKVGEDE